LTKPGGGSTRFEFQKIASKRSPGSSAPKRSLRRTRTQSPTRWRLTFSNVFSTATGLMSTAVTAAHPASAATTAVTPAPDPSSRNVPPTG
jgi:hypothetical protein